MNSGLDRRSWGHRVVDVACHQRLGDSTFVDSASNKIVQEPRIGARWYIGEAFFQHFTPISKRLLD